jgi:hypothetical protein
MPPTEHAPGCVLDPVHWLRHAVAASGRLISPENDAEHRHVDRVSAESLTDTLAHFAELDDWATVTLREVAQHATLMDDKRFGPMCTCGATR